MGQVSSAATLRQQVDANAVGFKDAAITAAIEACAGASPDHPLANGLVALDADGHPEEHRQEQERGP